MISSNGDDDDDDDRTRKTVRSLLRKLSSALDDDSKKFNVKITGDPNENLPNKVFEIQMYKRLTGIKAKQLYNKLVTKGLQGQAKDRYLQKARLEFDKIDTYKKLISFLFDEFNGDRFADTLYRKVITMKQQPNERIFDYWNRYKSCVNEYKHTVNMIQEYCPDQTSELITSWTSKQIYVKFINTLNPRAREYIRQYIELHDTKRNSVV